MIDYAGSMHSDIYFKSVAPLRSVAELTQIVCHNYKMSFNKSINRVLYMLFQIYNLTIISQLQLINIRFTEFNNAII